MVASNHHAGYQEKQRGISSELHTGIVGRFLVGFCIHGNSWVSDVHNSVMINQRNNLAK